MICVNCGSDNLDEGWNFFCIGCGFLNPLPNDKINYFSYLGIDFAFDINMADLELKYLNAMKKYHPDKFVNKPKEQHNALIHSSFLNDAYNGLRDELLRISHIYFVVFKENIIQDEKTLNNPIFMMKYLDMYERLDNAKNNTEMATFINDIEQSKLEVINKLSEIDFSNINIIDKKNIIFNYYVDLIYLYRILEKSKKIQTKE